MHNFALPFGGNANMKNTILLTLYLCCCVTVYAQVPKSVSARRTADAPSYYKQYDSTSPYLYNRSNACSQDVIDGTSVQGRSFTRSSSGWCDANRRDSRCYMYNSSSFNNRMGSYVYKPFSRETPSSVRRRAITGGEDDDDDDDWGYGGGGTGGNAGDPEQNPFAPIGDGWCLIAFAIVWALVKILFKNRNDHVFETVT